MADQRHLRGRFAWDDPRDHGLTTGVAPNALIMTLRFWNNIGGEPSVWDAMQYAVANGADVINGSLGWRHDQTESRAVWRMVCENAIAAGVVVVYAVGNGVDRDPPVDNVLTPGDVPDVITAGGTHCDDRLVSYSSRGPVTWQHVDPYNGWPYTPGKIKPTVGAPGEDLWSIDCRFDYQEFWGTSASSPHVAGTAALMLEADPDLDHFLVKEILEETALDLGEPGKDNDFGAGRVDAFAAVSAVLDGRPCRRADLADSGEVGFGDLLLILAACGPCGGECPEDLDDSGSVDFNDLLILLAAWGPCE